MSPALALLVRDVKLAWREGGAIGVALGFYLVVVAIMPFGLGPDLNLLARIAPGMLWVALLLAALLSATAFSTTTMRTAHWTCSPLAPCRCLWSPPSSRSPIG